MRAFIFLLSEILKSILRIEHKLDILLRERRPAGEFILTPLMKHQNIDPVSGQQVRYIPVNLTEHSHQVWIRQETDKPETPEPPLTVGP